MNNLEFLNCISRSFIRFLETGSNSPEKLKILHGAIALDLSHKLGDDYTIKSLGFNDSKEAKIEGRYVNKKVDITISKSDINIAGIGIKFVMQNYSQNSNNYFEGMLGETANIRMVDIPYFQILIIPDEIPYYEDGGKVKRWETFTLNNIHKYRILSEDSVETFIHIPTKTLLYVVKLPPKTIDIVHRVEYNSYYQSLPDFNIGTTDIDYGRFAANVVFNNYEEFIKKIVHRILSI